MNKDKEVEAYNPEILPLKNRQNMKLLRNLAFWISLRRGLEKPLRQRNGPDRWHNGAKETEK